MSVPVELDRDAARGAAQRELRRPQYQLDEPGLLERIITWLRDQVGELLDLAARASPGGWAGLAVVLLALVAAVVAVRMRVGPLARSRRTAETLFAGRSRTADEHRRAADAHTERAEWDGAVRERLRAVIRSLEERGVLDPRPGRTADEVAREAGHALPDCAGDLSDGARVFDEICYGGRGATAEHDELLRALDRRVATARPTASAGSPR